MSTLSVDTIEDRSAAESVDATYVVHGTLKVWLRGDEAANIQDSLNVSSMSDDNTGLYTANFTNSFADATHYVWSLGSWSDATGGANFGSIISTDIPAVGSLQVQNFDHAATVRDPTSPGHNMMVTGDLA
jgi:hypothetical protein